jgi:polyhydroxyalkanoate synthesis regulator phasin
MEIETIFKNAGEPWSQEEDTQLNKLYNEDILDIMEISKIHCRAPGGIISRLHKHNYIVNRQSARGYINYKNSDLYKEIVSNNKKKTKIEDKPEKKINQKQIDNILISINKSDYIELQNDVKEMKNEIKDLKNTIKELVEMMKAVYDFEDA